MDVKKDTLDRIKRDEESARDRLHEMLSERMKQAKPLIWDDIVDAVKCYDEEKSEDIYRRVARHNK